MRINRIFPLVVAALLLILPACFKDNNNKSDYSQWQLQNIEYLDYIATLEEDGHLLYTPVTPVWDPSITIYMRWHNEDEDYNPSFITPLSTSTCRIKYTLKNIEGNTLDSSSNFVCTPNQLVTGFTTALTNMRVNDTVTAVIPATAGYGPYSFGSVLPYSTLIFGIRLDSISRLY